MATKAVFVFLESQVGWSREKLLMVSWVGGVELVISMKPAYINYFQKYNSNLVILVNVMQNFLKW